MKIRREDLLKLTVAERLELLGEIWDSLDSQADLPALTDAERAEIDRRLDDYERDPGSFRSWGEVRDRTQGDT